MIGETASEAAKQLRFCFWVAQRFQRCDKAIVEERRFSAA
jgi:hypothetical protein